MNCSLACHLLDDYQENRLGRYDRQRLETHLGSCLGCAEELRRRSAFERSLWQALAASVQSRSLPLDASARIVREVQDSMRRAAWSTRVGLTLRLMVSVAAVALVVVGLFVLMGRIPIPSQLGPVPLLPVKQLILSAQRPGINSPLDQPILLEPSPEAPSRQNEPTLSLTRGESLIEPRPLRPGEPFTVTVFLNSDLPQPLDRARFDLDISGPTGPYHFPLVVQGPLPAHGVSVLRVTYDILTVPCQEKYLISPAEIFSLPGVYTLRVTLFREVSVLQK